MTAVALLRVKQLLTAGLVVQWLRMEFTELAFSDGFARKSRKFAFPEQREIPYCGCRSAFISGMLEKSGDYTAHSDDKWRQQKI